MNHHLLLKTPIPADVLQKILRDPLLLKQLSDRVYELMQADLRRQQERKQGYGRHY